MVTTRLPSFDEMYAALRERDASYEGVFFAAIRTTGIFCRPGCPARTPRVENVRFFSTAAAALEAGFRACKRCHPLELAGAPPPWIAALLEEVERDPTRRWRDADIRALGLDPGRVRRWFRTHRGSTFHAWQRARRLGLAHEEIRLGGDLCGAGYGSAGYESDSGFREAFARLFGEPPGRARALRRATVTHLPTPLGPMVAAALDEGLCLFEFADRPMLRTQLRRVHARLGCAFTPGDHEHLRALRRELREYFDGQRQCFELPLVTSGTPFQESVWSELARIPFGETRSYEGIACAIGRPTARRAVGRANGDNRLAILLPCHRVVGSDGSLTGYGGGLWRKRALLTLEQPAALSDQLRG